VADAQAARRGANIRSVSSAPVSTRDRNYILFGILLAMFLAAIDQTIVATALPRIVEDLGGLERYAWVFTAYLVMSTILVPIYGKLADMYDRRKIELWAIGLFLAGSFMCGLAGEFGTLPLLGDGMTQLILFRALQGVGAAGLLGLAFIIIADLFPPAERGKYQGLVGSVFGISSVLGPLLGGLLTDHGGAIIPGVAGWRWVFYVNLPFGVLALWFIIRRMPHLVPRGERGRLDLLSVALLFAGLGPLVLGLQLDKSEHPWGSPTTLTLLGVGVGVLALFVLRSLYTRNPILDLTLFRDRIFRTSNVAVFFLGAAFLSMVAFLPLFMVNVLGVSATRAGLSLVPLSLGVTASSTFAGILVSRVGHYRRILLAGGVVLLLGAYLLSRMGPDVPYWRVSLYMVIAGVGLGPSMPLYTLAVQNSVDFRKIGQATSAVQFFRQIGGALGTAVLGTVLATGLASAFATNMPAGAADLAGVGAGAVSAEGPGGGGLDEVAAGIAARFDRVYAAVAAAVEAGDDAGVANALAAGGVPTAAAQGVLAASRAATDPAARAGLLAGLRAELTTQAEAVTTAVLRGIRVSFAAAVTRVYAIVVFLVLAGWLVTFALPEKPLRKTHAPAPVVAGE